MKHRHEDDFHKPREVLPLFEELAPFGPSEFQKVLNAQPARLAGTADKPTSQEAADAIAPHLSSLQRQVLNAFVELGAMTDWELERLKRFEEMSPSTVRKRRSELVRAALVEECGHKMSGVGGKSKMTIHRARQAVVDKLNGIR